LPPSKQANQANQPDAVTLPEGSHSPKRKMVTSQRVIRDSRLGREIKKLYNYKCQVCSLEIKTNAGLYAEAAHIKPVGKPHNGTDRADNLLCLCPNHHLMLDKGVYVIGDDLFLIGIEGKLIKHKDHDISIKNIQYHRAMFS
jgi:putative restriction endonuclease